MNYNRLTVKICLFASVLYGFNLILEFVVSQKISFFSIAMACLMIGIAIVAAKRDRIREEL